MYCGSPAWRPLALEARRLGAVVHLEAEVAQQARLQLGGQAARAAVVAHAAQELPARQALSACPSLFWG